MSDDLEDDDEIFYGGGKPKQAEDNQQRDEVKKEAVYSDPYDTIHEPEEDLVEPASESSETKDIEAEISQTRREKLRAEEYHDITKLREKAAKHSAEAAKLFKKYRAEEAAMVKYQEAANKSRRKAEGYIEKSKDACAKADEKQSDLEYLEGRKAERARVKVAKYKAKEAKMKSKSSSWMAKAAKYTNKAAAKRQKAKAYLERSKTHEAESLNHNRRADRLQKA